MKIEYRQGSLFDAPDAKLIIHSCNNRGTIGSGFTAHLLDWFPDIEPFYLSTFRERGLKVGETLTYKRGDITILNLIGQDGNRGDGQRYTRFDAIADGIAEANERYAGIYETIHMPQMGATLGGAPWEVTSAIIEAYCTKIRPVVYIVKDERIRL